MTQGSELGATAALAEWVADIDYSSLSAEAINVAKLAIQDAVGVAAYGSQLPWSKIVREFCEESWAGGLSSVWGSQATLSPVGAALANGSSTHAIEFDDRHHQLQIHNAAATVPAALALAEHAGSTGRELLMAVACGYEVAFRVARATRRTIDRFYWPSLRSIFGATAASAKIVGLDAERTRWAFGIAGSMASGSWEFKHDAGGSMVKRLQGGGWPSQCGVTAALLANRGMTGPSTAFEGEDGFCRAFSTAAEPDLLAMTRDLGQSFEILGWQTKAYAAWGGSHTTIEGIEHLAVQGGFTASDIERIEIGVPQSIFWHSSHERPTTVMAAQQNLAFIAAVSLHHDVRDPSIWSEALLADPVIESLRSRTEVSVDNELDRLSMKARRNLGSKVRIFLHTGRSQSIWIRWVKGSPENPMTHHDVVTKFRALTGKVLPPDEVDALDAYLQLLDEPESRVDVGRWSAQTSDVRGGISGGGQGQIPAAL